jgi:hypothetical protein
VPNSISDHTALSASGFMPAALAVHSTALSLLAPSEPSASRSTATVRFSSSGFFAAHVDGRQQQVVVGERVRHALDLGAEPRLRFVGVRLPDVDGVDAAAVERRNHVGRTHVDDLDVAFAHAVRFEEIGEREIGARPDGDADLLALELLRLRYSAIGAHENAPRAPAGDDRKGAHRLLGERGEHERRRRHLGDVGLAAQQSLHRLSPGREQCRLHGEPLLRPEPAPSAIRVCGHSIGVDCASRSVIGSFAACGAAAANRPTASNARASRRNRFFILDPGD